MPPIAKESDVIAATPGTTTVNPPATTALSETPAGRPQPVALEVPVTVNGARTVDGTDKREPFSETTKTVLVLSNGAVIRLASSVAPGQLLFLTNEKTKKEVVCQVVKSKNYRNVSGYVELEFTEPVLGFWGMRFPNDRIAPAPVAPPPVAAVSQLATAPPAPKVAAPAATSIPETVKAPSMVPNPVAPRVAEVKRAETKPVDISVKPPEIPVQVAPLAAKPEIPVTHVPVAPAVAMPPTLPSLTATPANPVPVRGSTEALKLETARLQEQLSSMLFSGAPAEKAPQAQPSNPPAEKKEAPDAAAKIFDFAQAENAALKPASPARSILPAPSLDEENLKIPAWLEPLARNTIAPTSTQELIEREKARRAAEKPEISEPVIAPLTVAEVADVPEVRIPSFGNELLFDEKKSGEKKVSRGSNKGAWIGAIAAGLILVAGGGAWYLRQQGGSLKNSVTSAAAPAANVAASVLQPKPQSVAPAQSAPVNNLGAVAPPAVNASTAVNSQISTPHDTSASSVAANAAVVPKSTQTLPVQQQTHVVQEQPRVVPQQVEPQLVQKKPGLGEIHLASPKFNRPAASQEGGAAEPGLALNGEQPAGAGDSMGGDLVAGSVKQPPAPVQPLHVGGDVKPAKLLSSVPPVYSSLARSQHVTGDVKIDALIDANGRVTSTKVISGPTLLHQAAMEALRKWKYLPATLDGEPVPMHLTVTLQFRLQ
ncbi:MAG: TonB family protein [Candidatus Acidiferrales bacterium]